MGVSCNSPKLYHKKTLAGLVGFFVGTLIFYSVCGLVVRLDKLLVVVISTLGALSELLSTPNDNLVVSLVAPMFIHHMIN